MVKKILSAGLGVCILATSLTSCGFFSLYNTNDSDITEISDTIQNQENTTSLIASLLTFSTYDNILDSLRFMTLMHNSYKIGEAVREDFEYRYDLSTKENREMYEKLDDLVGMWYPPALGASSPYEDAFAYGIKDLNGDGCDELVIVEGEGYSACAVFTEKDGKIILNDSYSLESPSGEKSQRLAYWRNAIGLDLKPLFAESSDFDLDYIRKKAIYKFECSVKGMPFEDVWVPLTEEHVSLMDYVANTPSGKKPLSEIEDIKFAFVDMNNDTVDELVIDCGELIVLRVVYESIYLYSLSINQAYTLNTDGTFAWKNMSDTCEYGESRIKSWNVDGYHYTEELWKIINDGEPNAEYYIGSEQVTKEEMQKYFAENPKKTVEFLPFDELWGDMISPLEAIDVGNEYWKNFLCEETHGVELSFRSHSYGETIGDVPENVYVVLLVKYDSRHNSTFVDEIWVDKFTGEINLPYGLK